MNVLLVVIFVRNLGCNRIQSIVSYKILEIVEIHLEKQ